MIILNPVIQEMNKIEGREKEEPETRRIPLNKRKAGIMTFGITLGGAAVFYCRETRKLPQVNSI
jgi:hypothetical protein